MFTESSPGPPSSGCNNPYFRKFSASPGKVPGRGVTTMNARPAKTQNDYSPLSPPELGTWSPALSVSVVIPAHGGPHLELTLAALAAQTYPDHLMEVLVVDDG